MPAANTANVDRLAAAHRQLVADGVTQFDLPAQKPTPTPGWMQSLVDALVGAFRWLGDHGPLVRFAFWGLVAVLALMLARAIYRRVRVYLSGRSAGIETSGPGWRPEAAPARRLLAEADALAAAGQFAEAIHLLLLRSVEQIAARAPSALRPGSTSRDIAAATLLPGDVRSAFSQIAGVVEAALFAGRTVGADAWASCRKAYETVAFPKTWA